jgi:hypothetical protein
MEGIGWFVNGDKRIIEAVDQLQRDSDRAVGILAATLVEIQLTEALKYRLAKHPKIIAEFFRDGGVIGSFSAKIDLGHLLNLFTPDAYSDISIMKRIRNAFAHKPEMLSFATDSIKDRCFNLKLVDNLVGDITIEELNELQANPERLLTQTGPPNRFTGASAALGDARQRYIITAQLLSFPLGAMVDNPHARTEFVI